ncbi:MAG TPA: hypothetical protein VML75_14720 [Kofleriaceae bacterium]|nr:hypothetical protein [Kofleriaceae bacterium]
MSKKNERARTARRLSDRAMRKLVRDREKLAELEAGGSPARPIDVPTSAVIEGRARSTHCVQCEGQLDVVELSATTWEGEPRRIAHVKCRQCHVARDLWYRITAPLPS